MTAQEPPEGIGGGPEVFDDDVPYRRTIGCAARGQRPLHPVRVNGSRVVAEGRAARQSRFLPGRYDASLDLPRLVATVEPDRVESLDPLTGAPPAAMVPNCSVIMRCKAYRSGMGSSRGHSATSRLVMAIASRKCSPIKEVDYQGAQRVSPTLSVDERDVLAAATEEDLAPIVFVRGLRTGLPPDAAPQRAAGIHAQGRAVRADRPADGMGPPG